MPDDNLKERICRANKDLVKAGLVVLTWGNVSGLNDEKTMMAIKPSGVDYAKLAPADIVLIELESGKKRQGDMRPSSDSPTHLELYRAFRSIGGIVHTHSTFATAWAQAGRAIPCLGTTHADTFCGEIPACRQLSEKEVKSDYEVNVGKVIVEHFDGAQLEPASMPAVLVPGHGPFVWGDCAEEAVKNAIVLEEVARIAALTADLLPEPQPLPGYILHKHFDRKHGRNAYYGQK